MKPFEIIQKLESDNSRKFKEQVIEEAIDEGNETFFEGLRLCLDPLITFNIKQVHYDDGESIEGKVLQQLCEEIIDACEEYK